MKIILLANDKNSSWFVINEFLRKKRKIIIALEKEESRFNFIGRKIKRVKLSIIFGQILFRLFIIILSLIKKKYTKTLHKEYQLSDNRNYSLIDKYFISVNSDKCINWLKKERPDVIIINGTRIVSKKVLDSCNAIFLNIHCGITPNYRGVHGAYWALVNKDYDNIGVTIHQVDKGVDSGEILYQSKFKIDKSDWILSYPIKQYSEGIKLLNKSLDDIENQNLKYLKLNNVNSKIWQHPTLFEYLKYWFLLGVK